MQRPYLALALVLALTGGAARAEAPMHTFLVGFAEPPLAAYDGSAPSLVTGKRLAPTARRADQRKLDVRGKAARDYLAHLDARERGVLEVAAQRLGRTLEPKHRYRVTSSGFAVTLTAAEALALERVPGVASVRRAGTVKFTSDASAAHLGAVPVWSGTVAGIPPTRGEGIVVAVLDSGFNPAHPAFADIGGDGHDHTNPRGRFYGVCSTDPSKCNDKLIGIFDIAGTALTDPFNHGTSCASIAAGNVRTGTISAPTATIDVPVSGVAPHANLLVAAVGGGEDEIVAAIDAVVAAGADVLSMSFIAVSAVPDPWDALRTGGVGTYVATLNARAAGTLPVSTAGNDGQFGDILAPVSTAPWVIGAAASSHGRAFRTRLTDVTGTGITAPLAFAGAGFGAALAKAKIVYAGDFGFALCGRGLPQTNPTGRSNPFPAGTFNGEIVVCDRGTYNRTEKSFNVRAAGAGGMILANTQIDGESLLSDGHFVPAVHLPFSAAEALRQRLAAARAAGGEIRGAITATERVENGAPADVLATFSSHGPDPLFEGWLEPNLSAPGQQGLAADGKSTGYKDFGGTSMATPNVAGAAALVMAARPGWSVAQVESALQTTAFAGVRNDDGSPATPHGTGSGRVDIAAAVRASLYFDITRAQFVAADPIAGGTPEQMNLPSLATSRCLERCAFTRTVTDMAGGGTWRAEFRGPAAARVTVTPATFTLGAGESRQLEIAVDVSDPSLPGTWVYGTLALVKTAGTTAPETRLPVAVFADTGDLPATIVVELPSTTASARTTLGGLVGTRTLTLAPSSLERALVETVAIAADPTPGTAFDDFAQALVRILDVPPSTEPRELYVHVTAPAEFFAFAVGADSDGDGLPGVDEEELCFTHAPCRVDIGAASTTRRYWIYARSDTATTASVVAAAPIPGAGGTQLVATGPGRTTTGAPFDIDIAVNEPRIVGDETWLALLDVGTSPSTPRNVGRVPVLVTTTGLDGGIILSAGSNARAIDDAVALELEPDSAHERIAIDLPPGVTSLTATTSGTGTIELFIARAATVDATSPIVASAPPRDAAQASASGPGAARTATVLLPDAGRWFVTPVNRATQRASITLDVRVAYDTVPILRPSAYFNAARSGQGVFLSDGATDRVLIWYAYLQDGTPTWYFAQAPRPTATTGTWEAPLMRYTWDGSSARGTRVGTALVTPSSAFALTFAWQVEGSEGSEPMQLLSPSSLICPPGGNWSGTWFAPAQPGYGFSLLTWPTADVEVVYLYDAEGRPRWLYGQNAPFGSGSLTLSQFTGFCPTCGGSAVQSSGAGTLTRTFAGNGGGTANVSAAFQPPLSGSWSTNHAIAKLTSDAPCEPDSIIGPPR